MEEWLPRLGVSDGVLLLQDGVLALKGAPDGVRQHLGKLQGRLYALEADLRARGVGVGAAHVVDDAGAVSLLASCERVLAL
jgi:sulfur relay protein TusB/DsrH